MDVSFIFCCGNIDPYLTGKFKSICLFKFVTNVLAEIVQLNGLLYIKQMQQQLPEVYTKFTIRLLKELKDVYQLKDGILNSDC